MKNKITELLHKRKYYSLDNLLKENSKINLIWSGRDMGKSFAVKKWTLERCWKENIGFALIYRKPGTTKKYKNSKENYFKDKSISIRKITDGAYGTVLAKGDDYFWGNIDDETGAIEWGPAIGHIFYLDVDEQEYKSGVFSDIYLSGIYTILFEEFMTNQGYLDNEVYQFETLLSSILRDNYSSSKMKIFMLANPNSRICPYISEWNLRFMYKQKIEGEITTVIRNEDYSPVQISVERVPDLKKEVGSVAISRKGRLVEKGEWEVDDAPKMPYWQAYDEVYNFIFTYDSNKFNIHVLTDDNELFLLVVKRKKPINWGEDRVVGDIQKSYYNVTLGFTPICESERRIFNLVKTNKIFFTNDLDASDFYACLRSLRNML